MHEREALLSLSSEFSEFMTRLGCGLGGKVVKTLIKSCAELGALTHEHRLTARS